MADKQLRESMKRHTTGNPMSDAYNIMQETGSGPGGWEDWSNLSFWHILIPAIIISVVLVKLFMS